MIRTATFERAVTRRLQSESSEAAISAGRGGGSRTGFPSFRHPRRLKTCDYRHPYRSASIAVHASTMASPEPGAMQAERRRVTS